MNTRNIQDVEIFNSAKNNITNSIYDPQLLYYPKAKKKTSASQHFIMVTLKLPDEVKKTSSLTFPGIFGVLIYQM